MGARTIFREWVAACRRRPLRCGLCLVLAIIVSPLVALMLAMGFAAIGLIP